jgi:hypothetical protein
LLIICENWRVDTRQFFCLFPVRALPRILDYCPFCFLDSPFLQGRGNLPFDLRITPLA